MNWLELQKLSEWDPKALAAKKVFLRLDLNIPMHLKTPQEVIDSHRFQMAYPTVQYLLKHRAKVIIASHLGRPEKYGLTATTTNESLSDQEVSSQRTLFSMERVAEAFRQLLNTNVYLVEHPQDQTPQILLSSLQTGELILLENLRFHEGEKANQIELAKVWAQYTDIYINDAFGACHRQHASIVALPQLVPQKMVGFLIEKELQSLQALLNTPASPFIMVLGGAKVKDKIGIIKNCGIVWTYF